MHSVTLPKVKQRELFRILQCIPPQHSEITWTVMLERIMNFPMALDHDVACRGMS